MAQPTSSGWAGAVVAPLRQFNYSVSIAWSLQTASGINYFTIGQSTIGGPDIIKSGGTTVAFFDKYTYTDYSKYVVSIDVQRSIGQYPYGAFMAQADIELDNSSNLFLPGFDRTIGSGILPNRPAKISLGLFNEYLGQFVGFVGAPDLALQNRIATFHAYDAMNYINYYQSTASGVAVAQRADQIIASLMGEMGFGAGQYILDQSLQIPIGYAAWNGLLAGDVIQDLCEAEQALAFVDENGIFRFWNRQHFSTTSGTNAFNLTYAFVSDIQYENTPIINDVTVTANPRAVQASQLVWSQSESTEVLAGQSLAVIANFSDDNGALPVTEVDTPLPYSAAISSSYSANLAADGSGADMTTTLQLQSVYLSGTTYIMTFFNPTGNSIFLTPSNGQSYAIMLFGTPAKVTANIVQNYQDATSIATYGRNPANNGITISISNDYIQDVSQANSLCRTLVAEYKDARKRYMVPIAAGSNPALQIGDFGILNIEETGEHKRVWIVGREEKFDRQGVYTQTLELEERGIQSYFTIGVSTISGTDTIAP